MAVYVIRDGNLVEKNYENSSSDAPNVIRDEMSPLRHMADGNYYSSKRRFREATRDAGCVEIGNESPVRKRPRIEPDRRQRREDIRRAIHDLRDGRAPTIRHILESNKE